MHSSWDLILKIHLYFRVLFIYPTFIIFHDFFNVGSDAFSLCPSLGELVMDLLIHVISVGSSDQLWLLFAGEDVDTRAVVVVVEVVGHLAEYEIFQILRGLDLRHLIQASIRRSNGPSAPKVCTRSMLIDHAIIQHHFKILRLLHWVAHVSEWAEICSSILAVSQIDCTCWLGATLAV